MKIIIDNLSLPLCSPNKISLTCSFHVIVQRLLEREELKLTLHKITLKINQLKDYWQTLDPLVIEVSIKRIDEISIDLLANFEKNVENSELAK